MSPPVDEIIDDLKEQNREWVEDVKSRDPTFFRRTAERQDPPTLWIGCADSRVPESVILESMPGVIFTHRNIANQIFADDANAVSVITYALLELKVEHIIIAGHSRCGGVGVCLDKHLTEADKRQCFQPGQTTSWPPPPPIGKWLQELRDLAESYPRPPTVLQLVKENVRKQVEKVVALPVVKSAWAGHRSKGNLKGVHGWWYELETGYVHDLHVSVCSPTRK